MITWKSNMEETKRRYVNWWNHKGIIVNMWEHFQEGVKPHGPYSGEQPIHLTEALRNSYGTGAFGLPGAPQAKDGNQRWFDPQWRAEYLDWYVGHSCLKADILPVANTQLGPGSLASILGSRVEGGEDTIWIHPNPDFNDKLTFDPNNEQYLIHKALLKACKAKAQGNYYVGMPDLMEGLDVLAALKGTDKVLLDTVIQPEVVEEQLQFINDVYFKVFDELYDIIREGDEMAFCYFSCWAPGKMTKIQSDISTMISDDDYKRFVQPYLRQQCERIPYTLYHLDGVGAMHHLPSLLEIEELNAIQWTPGVGEPQGGDPKWYDLYKKILAGGKSIMACWVTLDQLRPLLDNIGGDGIHLEMDFKNEDEVEKALRIVEEYQSDEVEKKIDECISVSDNLKFETEKPKQYRPLNFTTTATPKTNIIQNPQKMYANLDSTPANLQSALASRILLLDGGMGTMVQQYGIKGCADELVISHPEIITDIHRRYLQAGADIIETDTFNAQRISLFDYGWQDRAREFNLNAAYLARQMADAFTQTNPEKPRYVAGSVGPTNKCVSFATGVNNPLNPQSLREAYDEQIDALMDGGVDIILIETIFDMENAVIAAEAAAEVMKRKGLQLPVMLSFAQVNDKGVNMNGQNIYDCIERISKIGIEILSVGLNCTHQPKDIVPAVMSLASAMPCNISVYANAGMPDNKGNYTQPATEFAAQCWPMIDAHAINIIGGCCGTTDKHIAELARLIEPAKGCFVSPKGKGSVITSESTAENTATAPVLNASEEEKPADSDNSSVSASANDTTTTEPAVSTALLDAIIAGNQKLAEEATHKAIQAGAKPGDLINTQMIQAMATVGQRFEEGTAFVPNLLMAGRAMKAALAILKPIMDANGEGVESAGRIVIGTVKGDLHDIGKNLVASMLEGAGFEVINIGIDVDADTFINAIVDNKADILCLSALLTTTMTYMKDVIDALAEAGIRDKVKVMVGGAPINEDFANEIGADGYSSNANEAVALAKRLMAEIK